MAQEQTPEQVKRLLLHAELSAITPVVYFQAPTNTSLQYPCIIYEMDDAETVFADDMPFRYEERYQIKIIDRDPDTAIRSAVARLPKCRFDRHYVADNLHHYVYNLFF